MTNKAYNLALKDLGTWEWGEGANPKIIQYFKDVGHAWVKEDETAWCAAFVGAMLKRSGEAHTGALDARSYLKWGKGVDEPKEGDVVVFWRQNVESWKGHVGFFVKEEDNMISVLGGNQGNQVSIARYPKSQLLGYRRSMQTIKTDPVLIIEDSRKSVASSTTMQASTAVIASTVGTAGTAISQLNGTAQIATIVFAGITILAAGWIMRERLKKWAKGIR